MGEWTQWENAHLAEHEKDGPYLSMKSVFCLGVCVCGWVGGGIMHRRCCQQAASSVHYTTSCKHSLVLPRMGEIISRNMLNRLKLSVNCYCCI